MEHSKNPYALSQVDISEWEIIGYIYVGTSEEMALDYRQDWKVVRDQLESYGLEEADLIFHRNGGCAACGTHFAHGAAVLRIVERPDQATDLVEAIAIGGICAGTWGAAEQIGVRKARAQRAQKLADERARNRQEAEDFLAERPDLAAAFKIDHDITQDIYEKLFRYGSISPKQADLVLKIQADEPERQRRIAARLEREARLDNAPALATYGEDRQVFEGTVISTKYVEGYNPWEQTLKMLVELDDLNRIWGTVPSALEYDDEFEAGVRVRFSATIQPSDDDEHFGFYKRPTKPEVVA